MESVIFFATAPDLEQLCSFTVSVESGRETKTNVQPHILKCREIIFTEPDVIASPAYDSYNCFHIVLQQAHFKTGRVQMRLQKQGLKISKPIRVHPYLYQSCLQYTIIARLAPSWNKAGEWFIQGRDFLPHNGYANAIKMKLCVNKDELFISLCATVIKFPPLKVDDLNLSRQEMLEILKSTEEGDKQVSVSNYPCHVLPSTLETQSIELSPWCGLETPNELCCPVVCCNATSDMNMNTGKICALSLTIPSDESPFSSYEQLKRHWKNMYGYRLPNTDEDILYCQVYFMSSENKKFTYPSVCLRTSPAQIVRRVEPRPIMTAFLQDIHSKVGSVCGSPLRFHPKLKFPNPSLHIASEGLDKANLSNRSLNKSSAPLRSVKSMAQMYKGNQATSLSSTLRDHRQILGFGLHKQVDDNLPAHKGQSIQGTTGGHCMGTLRDTKGRTSGTSKAGDDMGIVLASSPIADGQESSRGHHPLVDQHLCNVPKSSVTSPKTYFPGNVETMKEGTATTIAPRTIIPRCVETMKEGTVMNAGDTHPSQGLQYKQDVPDNSKQGRNNTFMPLFRPKVRHSNMPARKSSSMSQQPAKSDSFFPLFKAKERRSAPNKVVPVVPLTQGQGSSSTTPENAGAFSMSSASASTQILNTQQKQLFSTLKAPFQVAASRSKKQSTSCKGRSSLSGENVYSQGTSDLQQLFLQKSSQQSCGSFPKASGMSKNALEGGTSGICKKARAKPQIQNLDLEALAQVHQLNKVNTMTLLAWLKQKGVACKSKDKKNDLIGKVNHYLHIDTSEL